MSLWPVTVSVNGVAVDLDEVLADVTIRHGGSDVFTPPDPASCQITLLGVDRAYTKPFRVGGAIVITAIDGATSAPRFTGTITDARLENDELTIIGVGRLASLWRYEIGAGAWPAESWSARVTRAFTEAGLASSLALELGTFNPQMAARAGAPVALSAYLPELALAVGAVVADLPDGRILVQTVDSRSYAAPLTLASADVLYSPPWEQMLNVTNSVAVESAGGTATASDPASIADFGPYPEELTTELANLADAQQRANDRVARRAYPRWIMLGTPILRGYQAVKIGHTAILHDLPASAPYPSWQPAIEGWEDRINGDEWEMSLALSDPLISGLTLSWSGAPGLWNTINQTVAWRDALTPDDLAPV